MTDPSHALQAALVSVLSADAELVTILGGAKIYEHVPASTAKPWIVFDEVSARAVDAESLRGHIHRITLHCVSDEPGTRQCSVMAQRIKEIVSTVALTLNNHDLVNLAVTETVLRRIGKNPQRIMIVTLRAMTQQQP